MGAGQPQLVDLSVESVAGFKALVTEDWSIKGEDALASILRALAERVHPIALGTMYRSRQQIQNLARRLSLHRNDEERINFIVETLTKNLGSHDYMIMRGEARELLGAQVVEPSEQLDDLMWRLYLDFAEEMKLGQPFDAATELNAQPPPTPGTPPLPPQPVTVVHRLAMVESAAGLDVMEREVLLKSVVVTMPGMPIQNKVFQTENVRSGWTHYA